MLEELNELKQRVWEIEEKFAEMGYNTKLLVQSETRKKWKILPQAETMFGLHLGICVGTIDPWLGNAVRYFSPLFHAPDTPFLSLPYAHPISAFGGFDACGLSWVPPAGSTLCILFESGSRETAYYIGTVWHRDRGPEGNRKLLANCEEFYKIHEGHRKGYLVGPNDGSQCHPPWNTESGNSKDIDSIETFTDDPQAQKRITYPHIYGWLTPQKAGTKYVDGNYKCNHKGKRVEWFSSCGNYMIFKDDHIHTVTWGHPSCGATGSDISNCVDEDGNPIEKLDCEGETSNSSIMNGHPSTPEGTKYGLDSNTGHNPYFKYENECRPIKGPGTPQNNKLQLPQSGIQFLSISGHSFGMDDSVEEPRGVPEWERSIKDFDYGCNNKYLGKTWWCSSTGHKITLNDVESDSQLRGEDNGIFLETATGITLELCDETVGQPDCAGCPPNMAGKNRGFKVRTSSNHSFEMNDNENEQCGECRKDGGKPINKAKRAFIRARTGYGLEISMNDYDPNPAPDGTEGSQEITINQNIQVFCPQKDNSARGPHILRMQERPSGPGQIYLRSGGDYICQTYDNHLTIVGDIDKNPANKMTSVSGNTIITTEKFYFNNADLLAFQAKEIILLMAGDDCKGVGTDSENQSCSPCVWPVLCLSPKGVTISDRVFVSASPDAGCANIFQMTPFHSCDPFEGCGD